MSATPQKWTLSGEAFERLLQILGADRDSASREYEVLRRKLIHFFDWRGSMSPDSQADETLDRVARKLQEGAIVEDVNAYARGVARNVLHESERQRLRERSAVDDLARAGGFVSPPDAVDVRMSCLNACLSQLPSDSRTFIMAYYHGRGRVHLTERKALANRLGLSYVALKHRAHRVRGLLEECLHRCMDGRTGRDR